MVELGFKNRSGSPICPSPTLQALGALSIARLATSLIGPTAKSRPGPETSDAGCRSDMRRRSPSRREWPTADLGVGYKGDWSGNSL